MIAVGMRALRNTAAASALAFAAALAACGDTAENTPPERDVGVEAAPAETAPASAAAPLVQALMNPNEAPEEALMALPGMDSAAVAAILEGRPFESMLPLNEALSARLDSAALDELYRHMFIPVSLNRASRDEILLIPGVGERMAYEFEEYRPYEAMAQFRREIGKYVDDEEVARLERYVRLD
ncbi:MAG: hypothetical protein P8177_04860 [Gemmatimonadota bacterium]|jgi:DNA uptake protein ComE-like DNA-binding protein